MSQAVTPWKNRLAPALLGIGSLAAAIALIEAFIRIGWINRFIVPLPTEIISAIPRIVREGDVLVPACALDWWASADRWQSMSYAGALECARHSRFALTMFEAFAASLLVAVFGIAGGALLYRFRLLRDATETWVVALAAAPLVLIYPLYLVIFGRNTLTIVMMGFTAGVAPTVLKTLEGLAGTRRVLIDVGRSFNLTPGQQLRKILFPAALPTIFVGLRLGLIFALINVVGIEFLINLGGLGQMINELSERYDLAGTYAAICFVILVSIVVFVLTERLERWLRPIN
jgi:NitT/TauT family transport system permease protein